MPKDPVGHHLPNVSGLRLCSVGHWEAKFTQWLNIEEHHTQALDTYYEVVMEENTVNYPCAHHFDIP